LFELLEVAVFDLFHESLSAEEVVVETAGELPGHGDKLVVDHFRKRNGTAYGDEMHTPLEHEAKVPQDKDDQSRGSRGERSSARTEQLSEAIEKYAEPENEESCERNEKAVAIRRYAGPVRVYGDKEIEGR